MEGTRRKYFKKGGLAYGLKYFWGSKLKEDWKMPSEFGHMEVNDDSGENAFLRGEKPNEMEGAQHVRNGASL